MTKLFFSMVLAMTFAITAQAGNPVKEVVYKVKTDQSVIAWTGAKVTGTHSGVVNVKDGSLTFKDGVMTGGKFTIDMTSITVTDLTGDGKTNLEGHLKNDDFFGVDKHPTATLVVTKAVATGGGIYNVTGDLTIKGVTKPVNFTTTVSQTGKTVTAKSDIKIDRSLYDIKYGSGKFFENLGDKTIYDEFDLSVTLVAAE
jgi:polyisoprenoid-binding protein YceI